MLQGGVDGDLRCSVGIMVRRVDERRQARRVRHGIRELGSEASERLRPGAGTELVERAGRVALVDDAVDGTGAERPGASFVKLWLR